MKLNFITKDNQVLPVVDYRYSTIDELIENVVKCTVSSDRENQTIMTVTVFVDRPDIPKIQPPSFTVDGVLDTGRNL